MTVTRGKLYLVPASLGDSPWTATLPQDAAHIARTLTHFVVENAKTARADLKRLEHPMPLRELDIRPLPETRTPTALRELLAPALRGTHIGLMSEAGVPAVADPGALLVEAAHELDIQVIPLVGPSSLLLSLMASGLNGQQFAFHGYLPVHDNERMAAIKALEAESSQKSQTQLFIETPYRNQRMLESLVATCRPNTRLCIARGVTTTEEWIQTRSVANWKKQALPELGKVPTVFLLLA
ncbi:MAG TPA: SAM-dependent methyltransferase [Denitromonas sp.]|uniref:SAM-dependent methyltransferase n=1 Tax=Denitromonas sp. TaxID=2734609 RepID=UPI001D276278|nr:SAM-dependent methyltransferase [Rhodocyclaceae bacterium]MCP5220331.1 SAM-dependent methyltransferase [Zoogloeaceae bacterium]HQV13456.1 SAM-dependent methyltransferase [Denitromonas sp.]